MAGGVSSAALAAVRALVDFFILAQFQSHTDQSLDLMVKSLDTFHANKKAFSSIRDDFNIPKLHALTHYVAAIRSLGTADGYNTESPERLHIDYAKKAYAATNKKEYISQMTRWLTRQEAILGLGSYIAWVRQTAGGISTAEADLDPDSEEDDEQAPVLEAPAYVLAKHPPFQHLSVSEVNQRNASAW